VQYVISERWDGGESHGMSFSYPKADMPLRIALALKRRRELSGESKINIQKIGELDLALRHFRSFET
jgi:hypothetical protein